MDNISMKCMKFVCLNYCKIWTFGPVLLKFVFHIQNLVLFKDKKIITGQIFKCLRQFLHLHIFCGNEMLVCLCINHVKTTWMISTKFGTQMQYTSKQIIGHIFSHFIRHTFFVYNYINIRINSTVLNNAQLTKIWL